MAYDLFITNQKLSFFELIICEECFISLKKK